MERMYSEAKAIQTREMLAYPITPLARQIARKWFLPLEKLAARSGVGIDTISRVLRGIKVDASCEKKLKKFLDEYKGEMV